MADHNAPALNQQIVVITGGARGLGKSVTEAFLREGAKVIINYLNSKDAAEALADAANQQTEGSAVAIQADVTDPQAVQSLFAQAREFFGAPVTTVVNNALAAFSFDGDARPKADEISWERFTGQLEGNVRGAVNTTQAALPGFGEVGSGRIINIGTNLFQNPVVPYHDYTASKAALLSLTRTFAHDLGPKNITVNMLSGGLLRTTDASAATPDEVFDFIAAGTPLRSVTTPEEFADAILFFASPWSRSVTGQNLVVDGGLVMD